VSNAEHQHPTFGTFVKIGVVLFVITVLEWAALFLEGVPFVAKAGLIGLSLVKFILVGGYFMHLKWEKKLLAWAFAFGFLLATLMAVANKYVNMATPTVH
jgi:cytochrome c oxidase subunit 4